MQNEKIKKELQALRKENACLKAELSDILLCNPENNLKLIKNKDGNYKEQLLLLNKMKLLGVLINGVAHDINNPNHVINMNVLLLQKIWEDLKPFFDDIMKKNPNFKLRYIPANKLENGIDDLLFGIKNGSKRIEKTIESLKSYICNVSSDNREIFDLNDAIENVNCLLNNQIIKATSTFIVNRKSENLLVSGVQQKIEQVIMNVLQNSCQALISRDQSIQIETATDPTGKLAVIKIVDTGVGIEAENFNFITDLFFTTKCKIGGYGLGLAISSLILEEHEGYFKFSSEHGNGTTVEIILPLVHDDKNQVIQ